MESNNSIVEELLNQAQVKEEQGLKSIQVKKNVPLELDLGHLLASDPNSVDLKSFRSNPDTFIKDLTRDNVQLVIKEIWGLETQKVDKSIVAKLPAAKTMLPRCKRVPRAKSATKWEMFAKKKGIQKKKREKNIWDEASQEWKPRYGFHSYDNQKNDWMLEVKPGTDPNQDVFEKEKEEKKERIAKNEYQRLKNVARGLGKKTVPNNVESVPPVAPDSLKTSKPLLEKASLVAKTSTASLGKFNEKIKNEKPLKIKGKKRKFESNEANVMSEKEKNLQLMERVLNKKAIDVNKAIGSLISKEEKTRHEERVSSESTGGKKKSGSKTRRVAPRKQGKANYPRAKMNHKNHSEAAAAGDNRKHRAGSSSSSSYTPHKTRGSSKKQGMGGSGGKKGVKSGGSKRSGSAKNSRK